MKRLRRLTGQEHGFALFLTLAVTVIFGMTVVTVIESAASNSRTANRSKGRISAYSLAEAGINNAHRQSKRLEISGAEHHLCVLRLF